MGDTYIQFKSNWYDIKTAFEQKPKFNQPDIALKPAYINGKFLDNLNDIQTSKATPRGVQKTN